MSRINRQEYDIFRSNLSQLNWFGNIGQRLDYPHMISDPDDWLGPESHTVMPLGDWQQELFESFVSMPDGDQYRRVFEEVRLHVSELTKNLVPYLEDGDIWEWPNFAVAVASWTAGLVALCILAKREFPKDLKTQWDWYSQGRLPMEYVVNNQDAIQTFQNFYSNGPPSEGYVTYFEKNPNKFHIY